MTDIILKSIEVSYDAVVTDVFGVLGEPGREVALMQHNAAAVTAKAEINGKPVQAYVIARIVRIGGLSDQELKDLCWPHLRALLKLADEDRLCTKSDDGRHSESWYCTRREACEYCGKESS